MGITQKKETLGFKPIKHKSKIVKVYKAIVTPDFNSKTVLVRNHWDYVEMWLQKKKRKDGNNCIPRHPLTIILASMHRLSELARYEPTVIFRHFELKQNWLLSEFIKGSGGEFVNKIACEITNQNLMTPAVRTVK